MYLGDFAICVDWTGSNNIEADKLENCEWPKLGASAAPVKCETINPNVIVAVSGNAQSLPLHDGHTVGLFHFSDMNMLSGKINKITDAILEPSGREDALSSLDGKFACCYWDRSKNSLVLLTDPMRLVTIYVYNLRGLTVVATDLRILKSIVSDLEIDAQAIYHYLNFTYVPSPYCIYKNVEKARPGTMIEISETGLESSRYWQPRYTEDLSGNDAQHADLLYSEMERAVLSTRPSGNDWGTFLSGGTDSSSICGILASNSQDQKVKSFSIGFEEEGFDELHFAGVSAKLFGLDSFTSRVSATDTLETIDVLVNAYDEPFGNSSAIPTFHCAKLANEHGISSLLGGDGGDEIFGGNERYGKDTIFSKYYNSPKPVHWMGELLSTMVSPLDTRFTNRIKNFVNRGSLPNPDRFYLDDSFASEYVDELLQKKFIGKIDTDSSLNILRNLYAETGNVNELHRLMYIDLMMAISDNDLTKVNRTAKSAGVSVFYPYLNPQLIKFTGKLSANYKVRGMNKRYLFKRAVDGLLPQEILQKKKQGFGLPMPVWFRTDKRYIELINDSLLSQRAIERGYFNKRFIESLISRHQKGVWNFGQEIWILLMLELWHRKYVDQ